MLTSSPIASPRSFHYAPSRSPQQSPRVTAALPRRQSKNTIRHSPSPSLGGSSRPKQYVGVDAATQYSPMEPFNPAVPLQGVRPGASASTTTTTTTNQAAIAPATPVTQSTQPLVPSSVVPTVPPEPDISPIRPDDPRPAATALSPAKRRNSDELVAPVGDVLDGPSASAATRSRPSTPKRSRPSQTPPKVLPLKYELCDVEDMVVLISNMLGELIETNDAIAMKSGHLTRFHSRTAPGISVLDYLHRLAKHATLIPPLLLSIVYYIDRLCALYPDFTINTLTVHRFLITAATVAGKGLSDSFWNNSFYARVGGVKVAELKLLELEFLYRVDWKIVPNPEVLIAYYKGLIERCPGYVLEGDEDNVEDSDDIIDDSDEASDADGDGVTTMAQS